MIERDSIDPTGRYLDELSKTENELHEAKRAHVLRDRFLHDDYSPREGAFLDLHARFMTEKRGKNFGERFAMAVSDDYLGKVRVVELSSTDHDLVPPGGSYKDPYRDLLQWLVGHGIVETEIPVEKSGRTFSVKRCPLQVPHGVKERVIVTRVRPLLLADMVNESGTTLNFEIMKLSVFAMMKEQLEALYARYGVSPSEEWSESMMQHVEDLLNLSDQTSMHRVIHKIRTGYYVESHLGK